MAKKKYAPAYISMQKVAEALGVTRDTARRWCIRERCAQKRGHRYYTTRDQLIAAFPEAFRRFGAETRI